MTRRSAFLFLGLFALALARPLFAEVAAIEVDLEKNTVNPDFPVVNLAAGESVAIRVLRNGAIPTGYVVRTFLSLPQLGKWTITVPAQYSFEKPTEREVEDFLPPEGRPGARNGIEGYAPLIVFTRCTSAFALQIPALRAPQTLTRDDCPFWKRGDHAAYVYITTAQFNVIVQAYKETDSGPAERPEFEVAFPIEVVDRSSILNWSAGFAFLGVRDERYRLTPLPGDESRQSIEHVGLGPVVYKLAAFAHYMNARWKVPVSATFGLATDVPVESLSAMLGGTLTLRTLPVVNSGHITAGLAYSKRGVLRDEFATSPPTAPTGVSVDAITEQRYGFGWFVAVSFSFLGGEEQFKAVYNKGGSTK